MVTPANRTRRQLSDDPRLPPGQHPARGWPVLHQGQPPVFDERRWDLRVTGVTAGGDVRWTWPQFQQLPRLSLTADFHCVTRFSVLDNRWRGVAASTLIELAPPASTVTHVMTWAERGYCANLPLDVFAEGIFATHHDGLLLTVEHGFPLRLVVPSRYAWKGPKWVRAVEWMDTDRPGWWEQRGYHNDGDPWREERTSG